MLIKTKPADQRSHIMEAAKKRFLHYGYAKTTMAELARDCNMSSGNLYRFFPGKLDIAEAIAEDVEARNLEGQAAIVRRPDLTASQKLSELLFFNLRETYASLEQDPRIVEMAQFLARERPEFSNRKLAKQRSILVEIIAAGNMSGEFNVPDVVFAAEMIQSAVMKFSYPQLWSRLPLEKLERELEGVINLLVHGLDGPWPPAKH